MAKNKFACDCDVIHHDVVSHVSAELPKDDKIGAIADFYKIMGDPTRCKILFALLHHELCVCDIANLLHMSKSSVSHQLSKMRLFGVVQGRRQGKEVYYSLDDDHVAEILATTMVHIGHKQEGEHENG